MAGLVVGGSCTAILVASTPVSAATPSPGWSIDSDAEPTNFSAAETRDAVQVLAVSATGGSYRLSVNGGEAAEELSGPIAWNEPAQGLQAKLEAVPDVGAGNVEVSGGPGDEQGTSPYSIRYVGALSGRGEHLLLRDSLLTGGEATVREEEAKDVAGEAHDRYTVTATNAGSHPTEGAVAITDSLPPQLVVVAARLEERPSAQTTECSLTVPVRCEYGEPVPPGGKLVVTLQVAMSSPTFTGSLRNEATVSGGGGREASASEFTPANVGPAPFGIDQFGLGVVGLDGQPDLQAGDHPYGVTTNLAFNTVFTGGTSATGQQFYDVPREVKDVAVELPLGFVGDPLATERCPEVEMTEQTGAAESGRTACPTNSIVGTVWLTLKGEGRWTFGPYPVYNVAPEHGYPAELGFNVGGFGQPTFLHASLVPGPSGYRLRIATPGAIRALHLDIERIALTIFGDPSAQNGGTGDAAFVTNPTECSTEPVKANAEVTAWEGGSDTREAVVYPQVGGCDLLQGISAFDPTIELRPEQTQADTPSGYEVELKLPQAPNLFGQTATPELKDASITLPVGVALSPSAASGPSGLEGCTAAQIDLLGTEVGEGHSGGNGSPYDDGLTHASPGHCPSKSQIGDVELRTPLLEEALHGHVYVAAPTCGASGQPQCTEASASNGELYGIYLELAGSGVIIKLHGRVSADSQSSQLTATFTDNPQLPFEELRLTLYDGQRAPLANPQTCGTATTTSELEPWSAPASGPNATPSWSFSVAGCASPMGFAPGFSAGVVQTLAGSFTPFTLTLTRNDGEQDLAGLSLTMPPGLEGMISKVPLCGEPQAQRGECPEASRIGTATVAAGAGTQPLRLVGRVYLTGPYRGAPFGLSIVVPAKAGPFNLGDVVVRSAIGVNPHTAQITVASDALPQIRDGIPFRLKTINVTVDRPGFMFNPTDCRQLHVNGAVSGDMPDGSPGATVAVSNRFAVAGCKNLPFRPTFSVHVQARHSKRNGASLHVVVRSGEGQANISLVHVVLPKLLPSRLSTLNKACPEATFQANPASCPVASRVGSAKARTPVLPVALTGPAYFVSHGGAKFPELVMVLQGDGVTIDLAGETFISKKGITSSTFGAVPDVPITRFDLSLPTGVHSALAATGNLCKGKLVMPTTIQGHNGVRVRSRVKVRVAGCPKHRVKKPHHHHKKKK
jgi:hypothetical protein